MRPAQITNGAVVVDVRKALRGFELRVKAAFLPGVTVLVGPSGAGKTMLLRTMAGLTRPDAGTVSIGGRVVHGAPHTYVPPKERRVGFVFQDYALFPHLTVTANVAYGLDARRIRGDEGRRRVDAMLRRLAIADLAGERPARLSGGQRQRVALARALVIEPAALFLDEPLAALDVLTRSRVRAELVRLLPGLAIPAILVSHDPSDAAAFPQRVVAMEHGRIVADGTYETVRGLRTTEFLATFADM